MSLILNGTTVSDVYLNGVKCTEAYLNGTLVFKAPVYAVANTGMTNYYPVSCSSQDMTSEVISGRIFDGTSGKIMQSCDPVTTSGSSLLYITLAGGTSNTASYYAKTTLTLGKTYKLTIQANVYTPCAGGSSNIAVFASDPSGMTASSSTTTLGATAITSTSQSYGATTLNGEVLKREVTATITSSTSSMISAGIRAYRSGYGSVSVRYENVLISAEEL